jgi:hypothetical protein
MKKIIIVLLFGLLVVLNPGCKSGNDFDITGTWVINTQTGDGQFTNTFIFTGTKAGGAVTLRDINSSGSYTVVGDAVQFSVSFGVAAPLYRENYTGQFDSEDAMSGNFDITLDGAVTSSGTWTASR